MPLPIPNNRSSDKNSPVPEAKNKESEIELPKLPASGGLPGLPMSKPRPKRNETDREIRSRDPHSPLLDEVIVHEEEVEPGWEVDKTTGKKFKALPKSEYDAEGNPVLQVDIDTDNLNNSANEFLAHLRVAPSKEELKKMREEYAAKRRAEKNIL